MTSPFKIKKEERWLAVGALILFVLLNILTISNHWYTYTMGAHGGFWTLFTTRFSLSGYDCWSWITVSEMRIHFATTRHPLYLTFLYPMYLLNHWLMGVTGINFSVFFIGIVIVMSAVYSAIFLYRILREIIGLRQRESIILVLLFFSFGHVMVPSMVPDHFIVSTMLLLLTIYIASMKMLKGRQIDAWQSMILLFFTTGMAASNGIKTLIATWFVNRRHMFRPRYLFVAVIIPLVTLVAINRIQYYTLEVPQKAVVAKIEQAHAKHPNLKREKQQVEHKKWAQKHDMQRAGEGILRLMDFSSPRLPALVENFIGEAIIIHPNHALCDVLRNRPVIVTYDSVWSYALITIVMIFFMVGLIIGFRERLLQLLLLWLACDVGLHLILGFAINECYIMASGWIFIVPISIGYLMRRLRGSALYTVETITILIALILWIHNGTLIFQHLM